MGFVTTFTYRAVVGTMGIANRNSSGSNPTGPESPIGCQFRLSWLWYAVQESCPATGETFLST